MGRTITAPNVISGTHGKAWWNGDALYEIVSMEGRLETDREDIRFAGDMISDSKLLGVKGTYSITIRKVFSRGKEYAEAFMRGEDPRFEIVDQLKDPDAYGKGYEKVQYLNCWLNNVPVTTHQSGSIVEETYEGGFTGLKFLSSIAPVAQS